MLRPVKHGSTDQSVVIRIVDSTDGTPETGVVYNSSGINLWYRREGAALVAITEASLANAGSAHSDGGFVHIAHGYYRVDLPDAAFASGAAGVMVGGDVTGMVVIGCYVPLVAFDPQDATALGLSRLDAAISSRSSHAASDVWSVGTRALTDKAGFSLAATGLDLVTSSATGAVAIATAVWAAGTRTLTAISDSSGVTTLLSRLTSTRAGNLDNLDATVSSRSTYAGGAVASVTDPVTVGTNNDKTGYGLADGAITAAKIASGAIAAAKFAADFWSTILSTLGLASGNLDTQLDGKASQTSVDDLPTNSELATALSGLNDLDAAGVRAAVGLASANLDTQLADLPTNGELATALGGLNDLSQADIRTALGMAGADLDTQLDALAALIAGLNDLDAAGIRSALGLATANLDTQLAGIATDAEAAAGLTIPTPLDAAGTRAALGLASANLDTQLAAKASTTDVTGARDTVTTAITTSESNIRGGTKTLQALSTEIANIEGGGGVGSGSGTEQVVVTVLNEEDDEVPNAAVVAKSAGVVQASGVTGELGTTEALNLNVGTYVLDVDADGYEMETEADVPGNRTLVVENGTVAKTVKLKLRVVPPSDEPDSLTLEIYILQRNEAGDGFEPAGAGIDVKVQITDSDQDGLGVVNPVLTATTGADSRAYFTNFPMSSRYKAWIDGSPTLKKSDITAATGPSHELPFIVGEA